MVKLKVYSESTRIDCEKYSAQLSAASCAARHQKGNTELTLLDKRRGEHLRNSYVAQCKTCPVGQEVRRQLEAIEAKATAKKQAQSGEESLDDRNAENADQAKPPKTNAPPNAYRTGIACSEKAPITEASIAGETSGDVVVGGAAGRDGCVAGARAEVGGGAEGRGAAGRDAAGEEGGAEEAAHSIAEVDPSDRTQKPVANSVETRQITASLLALGMAVTEGCSTPNLGSEL